PMLRIALTMLRRMLRIDARKAAAKTTKLQMLRLLRLYRTRRETGAAVFAPIAASPASFARPPMATPRPCCTRRPAATRGSRPLRRQEWPFRLRYADGNNEP